MKYYLSIDAGGSKTDTVLVDQNGNVLAADRGRGANAFDIGPTEATSRICEAIDALLPYLPQGEKLSGVFGSVSVIYFYPEIQERVAAHLNGVPCKLDSVVSSVMAAVLGKEDGVCLISGTGSYCCVRQSSDAHRHYFGSSGYLLDTGGSAYTLGQQVLVASQRELDGRGPKTLLTKLIQDEIGESVLDHLPVIYEGGRPYIASFSHHVFTACREGDAVAKEIFDRGVDYYAEALAAAYQVMGKPYKCVLGGGTFLHHPEYVDAVRARAPEGCQLVLLDVPAVYGGALEAIWLSGEEVPDTFRTNFIRSYARFPLRKRGW